MMFDVLTKRERQVAALLALGEERAAISKRIGRAVQTIDTHRKNALKKLGARNAADLVRFAIREGFISMHDEAK